MFCAKSLRLPKWSRVRSFLRATVPAAAIALAAPQLAAAPIVWIGGNADWDATFTNWNPADEPDFEDEAIFNTPNTVDMALASNQIQALTLSGGIDLRTNGNDITIDGPIELSGAGTNFIVGGAASGVLAHEVTVNANAVLNFSGGILSVLEPGAGNGNVTVIADGVLSGNGLINLGDSVVADTTLFLLSGGTLNARSDASLADPFGANAATLTISIPDFQGRADLDNASASVIVSRNDTLEINGQAHGAADAYSGTMTLGEGATLDVNTPWVMDTATINVNTGSPVAGQAGAAATIIAPSWTMTGGTIDLDAIDSLRLSTPFTAAAGSINNAGLVIFNANSTIGALANLTMTGSEASITVNAGVTVNIDDPNFDADANAATGNIITVGSNALLDLDLGAGADESIGGRLFLNGGDLSVTTADANWVFDGIATVGADSFASQILGDAVTFTNGSVTVTPGGSLLVIADNTWTVAGNLATNGTTRLAGTTTFNNAGSFTGTGSLRTAGDTTFVTATTINMPSGNVDLDGGDSVGNTVTVDANTTINVETMSSFGADTIAGGDDTLVLNNFASLTVNLTDPDAEWTLTSNGVLDINAVGGMLGGSGIQGSDFNMAGTATISGNSIWGARTDLSGTTTVAAAGSLNLRGGDLTDGNVNRLVGGSITGTGALRALIDEGLFGFGTIATDIEFLNNTELRADGGTLTLSGSIVDVGVLGTADDDGILNVTLPWNTNVADLVELDGGEIRNATITNDGAAGINGNGRLTARVINNTRIDAEGGGALRVNNAANNNDWDGDNASGNNGQLNALSANLEIVDDAMFTFEGTVRANNGFEVFVNGFQMDLGATSALNLSGGTYRTTNSVRIGGSLTTTAASTLVVPAAALFQPTSNTVLNNDLRLDVNSTSVSVGATFSGGGSLVNLAGSQLNLADTANVGVLVENEGILEIAGGVAGQADVDDFQQSLGGRINIDLSGTGLNDIDRLDVNGAAQLAGTLDLSLIGTYVPSVADPLMTILSATSGRTGAFSLVNQPPAMPAGLLFDVIYTPTLVQLQVINGVDTWDNSTGNAQWSDGLNWGDDSEPTSQVVATFPAGFPNGDTTVTLSANETARSLSFLDSYTLAGGSLTLGPAASISVDAGKTATISSILNLSAGLTKTGDGTLTLNHVRATTFAVNSGEVVIASNGGDAGTSVVHSLATNGASRFDLNNNDLVVRATAATKDAVHDAIQDDIVSAQNGIDASFITNWDGPGITSSFAHTANVMTGFDLTGIGAIRNSDLDIITGLPGSSYTSFSGQPVTPDDVLVKYTYIGDGNLDGLVSFDDYVGMDNAFFGLIPNLGWATGDINFDGLINFDDYTVVDQAFFFQGAPLGGEVAAVPEPNSWLLTLVGLLTIVFICGCGIPRGKAARSGPPR